MPVVTIHFYAGLRELAKVACLRLEWRPGMTVTVLRQTISGQFAGVSSLLARSSIAVNDQMVGDEDAVPDEADIALLPPMSGG